MNVEHLERTDSLEIIRLSNMTERGPFRRTDSLEWTFQHNIWDVFYETNSLEWI